MDYTPDKWVVVEVCGTKEPLFKVFGSWSGGYTGNDHWRMNSGIVSCRLEDGKLHFVGYSGSEYICNPEMYGVACLYNLGVIERLIHDGVVKYVPEDTDWVNFEYV